MILLFLNGRLNGDWWYPLVAQSRLLVGVDGGARHLIQAGYQPDLVIGDLDSLPTDQIERLQQAGVLIRKYPKEKDETDLELALLYLFEDEKVEEPIYILAGTGGRTDQMLGNLFILLHPKFSQKNILFLQEKEQIYLLEKGVHQLNGVVGATVSLLPIGRDVFVQETDGLYWNLAKEWVYSGVPRGISNRLTKSCWTIVIEEGALLVVYSVGVD